MFGRRSDASLTLSENPAGQGLILTTLAMLGLGVVMVHSAVASVAAPGPWYARVDIRHTIFAAAAAVILLTACRIDYRRLAGRGRFPVLAGVALALSLAAGVLVFVPGIGHSVGGYYRWIRLGPREYTIGFQPSELMKLTLVVFLAAWLTRDTADVRSFLRTFLPAILLIGLCIGLLVTQDISIGAILGLTGGVTLLLARVPLWHLLTLLPPAAGGFYYFVMCDPKRWQRILAMVDPWSPDNPSAYQARQSLLAVVTGGWTGKGIGNGMLKLGFVPEDSTDFIFSVFCEEWGFLGAVLLMGLVLLWIWQVRRAAVRAQDRFGATLAGSLGFLIGLQAVLHVAVDLVAAPPTGMGLPFVSAGGTSLLLTAAATAMIASVTARPREDPAADVAPAPA